MAGAALAFSLQPSAFADSQGYPSAIGQLTNVPAVGGNSLILSNGAAIVWSNNIVASHAKGGLSFQTTVVGTNGQGGNLVNYFYLSNDGSNYCTAPFAIQTIPLNGANVVIAATNWNELQLRGFLDMSVTVSNASGTNIWLGGFVTNGIYGFVPVTNSLGVITNQAYVNPLGVLWDRPNL